MATPATKLADKSHRNGREKVATPFTPVWEAYPPLKGKRFEILDPNGKVINPDWMPDIADKLLVEGYKMMKVARAADLKAVNLQRQGRLYTLPVNRGQEAAAVGSAMAIKKTDWMVPAFREIGAMMWHGVPLTNVYLWYAGLEKGSVMPDGVKCLPTCVPISSQLPHAAGIAHAIKYQGLDDAVLTYFGDGGTSEGDFSEALNWAAVFKCPVVFFINNNQYAISVPREVQTAAKTLAQKAIGFEIPGIQVDGNDLLAVYRATHDAIEYARAGNGPVLIEAETYRMGAHTTSDDPTKYRTDEEEKKWAPRDPLIRVKKYLESKKLWDQKREEEFDQEASDFVDAAFAEAEKVGPNPTHELFENMFEAPTNSLIEQREDLEAFLKWQEGKK